eukprot:scaffold44600_cov31-Phaeocystis_antarctica.AAC.1
MELEGREGAPAAAERVVAMVARRGEAAWAASSAMWQHVARTHSGVEGEARGYYRVESRNCSVQAALLVETRGTTIKGMTEMVGAERVGAGGNGGNEGNGGGGDGGGGDGGGKGGDGGGGVGKGGDGGGGAGGGGKNGGEGGSGGDDGGKGGDGGSGGEDGEGKPM